MSRFSQKTGSMVRLTNNGTTAQRINASEEFNNGVVFSSEPLKDNVVFEVIIDKKHESWNGSVEIGVTSIYPENVAIPANANGLRDGTWIMSGSQILKDGRTIAEDYGQDLDQLGEGDRVGVLRSPTGGLHFYVNGVDQGMAASGLPECVYAVIDMYGKCIQVTVSDDGARETRLKNEVANEAIQEAMSVGMSAKLLFHEKTGSLVELTNGRRTAERRRPQDEFNNGVVMTNRPLEDDELFEIRIDRLVEKWSGSIEVGITTHNPNNLDFPSTMTNMRSGTVMMSGCGILTNGKGTRREYGNFNLDELKVGDRIGLIRKNTGALHYYINDTDQGVAATLSPRPVWGVVDLYGRAVKITILDQGEGPPALDLSTLIQSDIIQISELLQRVTDQQSDQWQQVMAGATAAVTAAEEGRVLGLGSNRGDAEDRDRLLFHAICGQHAKVTHQGRTAVRHHADDEFNNAIVLSNRPLRPTDLFEVQLDKLQDKWVGSLAIGVSTSSAADFTFPSTLANCRSGTWLMTGSGIMRNGSTIIDNYGPNLDHLKVGDRVGVLVTNGMLYFFVNGSSCGVAASHLPSTVYGVVDLYGQAAQISLVDSAAASAPSLLAMLTVDFPLPRCVASPPSLPPTPSENNDSQKLRFHPRHGTNAVVVDDGRTATRLNAEVEFNDAVVMTNRTLRLDELFELKVDHMVDRWTGSIEAGVTQLRPDDLDFPSTLTDMDRSTWMLSGTAIMKNGSTVQSGYTMNLDELHVGSRVGMMRKSDNSVHFFLDGVDMGPAFTSVPQDIYGIIDLYGQCVQVTVMDSDCHVICETDPVSCVDMEECSILASSMSPIIVQGLPHIFHNLVGKNLNLSDGNATVQRRAGADGGLAFSSHPLRHDDIFEVKVDEVNPMWAGSLSIGLTCLPVYDLQADCLPTRAQDIKDKVTWIVRGNQVLQCGRVIGHLKDVTLDCVKVGDAVGVQRSSDGSMHLFINGLDCGPVVAAVPKSVFAVVDVSGCVMKVSVCKSNPVVVSMREISRPPSIESLSSLEQEEDGSDGEYEESIAFHDVHGQNISLASTKLTAIRSTGFNHALVFSARPLQRDKQFKVYLACVQGHWTGSVMIGLTTLQPDSLDSLPHCALDLPPNTWVIQGDIVYYNSSKLRTLSSPSLDRLPACYSVGVLVDKVNSLHLFINDLDQGVVAEGLPSGCYVVVDLYGRCQQVSLIPVTSEGGGSGDGVKNKTDISPKEKLCQQLLLKASRTCLYQAMCRMCLQHLALPKGFFSPLYNMCYCGTCQCARGDKATCYKGDPARSVAVPLGWCKFALKLRSGTDVIQVCDKWHVGYRGVHPGILRRILDTSDISQDDPRLLLSKPNIRACHEEKQTPEDRKENQTIWLSPSVIYATNPKFSHRFKFDDKLSGKSYSAAVALQVYIKPGSYKVQEQRLGTSQQIDPHFSNSELEWTTKEKGATVPAAVLIFVE